MEKEKINSLTLKQEKFVNLYLECGNASEAYRLAYDCSKMMPQTINRKAQELMNNGKITARLHKEKKELQTMAQVRIEEILQDLTQVMRSNIAQYVEWDGNALRIKALKELDQRQQRVIESIKETKYGPEIKLRDKTDAIDKICKLLGYYAPEKQDLTTAGKQIAIEIINNKEQVKEQDDEETANN